MLELKYKRILLKLSGEALAGEKGMGIDFDVATKICESIKKCTKLGVELAIVVGGGNFWRGRSSGSMDRSRADHMGMLATVMNALALCDVLEQMGVPARVQSALSMPSIAELFVKDKAVRHLQKGRVVIFGCGTGCPHFSTDTASSLRAAEIGADVMFKATMVDGVYDKDPNKFNDAKFLKSLTYQQVLDMDLKVMDKTAISLLLHSNVITKVFSMDDMNNFILAIEDKDIGTIIKEK